MLSVVAFGSVHSHLTQLRTYTTGAWHAGAIVKVRRPSDREFSILELCLVLTCVCLSVSDLSLYLCVSVCVFVSVSVLCLCLCLCRCVFRLRVCSCYRGA